jgi:MFS transporter, DHA1 family, multidrug resistance protein
VKPALPAPGSAPTLAMALLLAVLSMVSPLSIDTFFPSFRALSEELHLSLWQAQQTITAYMVPYACFTLVHGPLSDALGRRPMVIAGMLLYTLASIGCVFAPSFAFLLVFRMLQGTAAGIGPTIARAVVRDLYEGPQAQRLMSAMMMIFSIAPAIGPILGGWIHVAFGWRAVFGFMVLIGGTLLAATLFGLPETHPQNRRSEFHLGQLARTTFDVMRHPEFILLAGAGGCAVGAILAYVGAAPSIVLDQWHLGETQFAALFVPIISGFVLSSFISGRVAGRWERHRQLRVGYALLTGGAALFIPLLWLLPDSPILLQQLPMFVMAAGTQLVFPILTLEMLDMFPRARGSAASVQSFVALSFGSIVIGAIVPALHSRLRLLAILSLLLGICSWCACWLVRRQRLLATAGN